MSLRLPHAAWVVAATFALAAGPVGLSLAASDRATDGTADPVFTATAPGWVDVDGGVQRLGARIDGIVQQVAVKDGDLVSAGDLLLSFDHAQAAIEARMATVEEQRQQVAEGNLAERIQRNRSEIGRLEPLVAAQAEPADELRSLQQALADLQAQLAGAKLAEQTAALQSELAKEKLGRLELRAPARGQVLRVLVHAGESVASGGALLDFVGDGPLLVRAELDERLFGRVRAGMRAQISSEYDEAKTYPAVVLRVARAVGPVQALPQIKPAAKDDRVVECVLRLDDPSTRDALLIGQRVLVRIKGGT